MANIVDVGEKLHIITRRIYKDDLRRHFAGVVMAVSDTAVRVQGYVFVFNPATLEYRRRPEVRTRIFPLADAGLITIVLPQSVNIDRLHYHTYDGRLVVTDGSGYTLDVNEFGGSS